MVVMGAILTLYYIIFIRSMPADSLEHAAMYDYVQDYYHEVKRDVSGEPIEGEHHNMLDQYYDYVLNTGTEDEEDDNDDDQDDIDYGEIFINKRNVSPSPFKRDVTNLNVGIQLTTNSINQFFSANGNGNGIGTPSGKGKSNNNTPGPQTTVRTYETLPDLRLSNSIVNEVFDDSERENMTLTLGLCRKNSELKTPTFNATMLSAESSSDINNCINNILKNLTENKLCYHLDPEMFAYLRWLVLMGEPRDKIHKPGPKVMMPNVFLFSSDSCEAVGQEGSEGGVNKEVGVSGVYKDIKGDKVKGTCKPKS